MVKKGKFSNKGCGKLKKKEQCGNDALCEWNMKKNKCAHVCDGKKKNLLVTHVPGKGNLSIQKIKNSLLSEKRLLYDFLNRCIM